MPQPQPQRPIKLYRFPLSGHSHRVELFLSLLGLRYEPVEVDLPGGANKRPEFLTLNSFGQVPVIDDAGVVLADSNAILVYLAMRYAPESWLPRNPAGAAQVQRWLSVAAGQLAGGPARARLVVLFKQDVDISDCVERAHQIFTLMEQALGRQGPFITGATVTIADVALYTYTAHAPEGNVSLADYPVLRSWLKRVEALPGFTPMQASPVALAA